jgi:hypothetical protein
MNKGMAGKGGFIVKKKAFLSLVFVLVALVLFTSCTPVKSKLPVNPYDQASATSVTPAATNPTRPAPSFASATPVTYQAPTGINIDSVQYIKDVKEALGLNPAELALLQQNGFVVTDRLAWDRFLDAYAWIYSKDLPVLVTTDSILHSVHQSYDDLLIDIERAVLVPGLKDTLSTTLVQLNKTQAANQVKELEPLYQDVATYLSVACALLTGSAANESPARELNSLAVNASACEDIYLFGNQRKIDFTLFKPRGHYTRGQDLVQYFRAMNWLAQIDFRFVEFEPGTSKPVLRPNQVAAAAILREAIDSAARRDAWNKIDALLKALVGESDNTTLSDLDRFMADMHLSGPAEALKADGKQMLALLLSRDYGYQRITGQLISRDPMNFSPEPIPRPVSFLLMGQRFAIDSYVLGNLVYDRMIKDGRPLERPLPSALDVMYTLGNDRALTHLSGEIERYGYRQHLAAMRAEVDSLSPQYWTAPLYNQWLGMIRTLNTPTTGEKYPRSLRTAAWADKMLQTQLASWAQLRHDNILYIKQSYTMMVACEYPKGYVEPYPEFYNALYAYARAAHEALSGVATGGNSNCETTRQRALTYLNKVMSTAMQLKTLAEKELALQDFTPQEELFLKNVVVSHKNDNRGCGGPAYTWDGWYVDLFYQEDDNPALIADVHTNPNERGPLSPARVLHAATGAVVPISLVAETDEGSTLYVGPCFTYYEVIEEGYPPVRLTDQDWQSRLNDQKLPLHPDWTKSFLFSTGNRPAVLKY